MNDSRCGVIREVPVARSRLGPGIGDKKLLQFMEDAGIAAPGGYRGIYAGGYRGQPSNLFLEMSGRGLALMQVL